MEYIRFGHTGMTVSRICLGTMTYGKPTERWPWALNEEQSRPFIKKHSSWVLTFLTPPMFTPMVPAKRWSAVR
jgi:hypothetical protein